jgi:hypothetical protein
MMTVGRMGEPGRGHGRSGEGQQVGRPAGGPGHMENQGAVAQPHIAGDARQVGRQGHQQDGQDGAVCISVAALTAGLTVSAFTLLASTLFTLSLHGGLAPSQSKPCPAEYMPHISVR